jgi:competence protein ComEA
MNKSWWWIAAFIIVGLLFGAGVIYLITRPPRGIPIELLPAPTQSPIIIYVSGAVEQAGIYSLPLGSRVNDAIQAAGGFAKNANTEGLNLAKMLQDGEHIVVLDINSSDVFQYETRTINPSIELVNINTATLEELDALPGIGPKTAQNILDYRNANGLFKRIEDIQDVPEIGPVTFEKIKDLITIGMSP